MFAFVSFDDFLVAIEREFNPSNDAAPIVIGSRAEDRVIAFSREAGPYGFWVGQPYADAAEIAGRCGVRFRESRPTLYDEISRTVLGTLALYAVSLESLTLDTVLMELVEIGPTIYAMADQALILQRAVRQANGIRISVGIGATPDEARAAHDRAVERKIGVYVMA